MDGAGAWKEELKPPGFVFSLVFPNEIEGAVAVLVGTLDAAGADGAPNVVAGAVELPKDGAAGVGAPKPDGAGLAPNAGAAGVVAGLAPNDGAAGAVDAGGAGTAVDEPKDGAGAAKVAGAPVVVDAPKDGAAGAGADGVDPNENAGAAELVAGAGALPNLGASFPVVWLVVAASPLAALLVAPNWNLGAGVGADAAGADVAGACDAFEVAAVLVVPVDVLPNESTGAFATGSAFLSAVLLPLAPNWNAGAGVAAATGGLAEVAAGVCPKVNAGADGAGAAVDVDGAVEAAGFDTSAVGLTRFRLMLRNNLSSRCSLSRLSSILAVCHAPTRGCLTAEP